MHTEIGQKVWASCLLLVPTKKIKYTHGKQEKWSAEHKNGNGNCKMHYLFILLSRNTEDAKYIQFNIHQIWKNMCRKPLSCLDQFVEQYTISNCTKDLVQIKYIGFGLYFMRLIDITSRLLILMKY